MTRDELQSLCTFFDAKSYRELADKMVISYAAVRAWSQGKRIPSPMTLKRIDAMKEAYAAQKKQQKGR